MLKTGRILGCILGGAIGDCLGGPYEGLKPPVSIDPANTWRLSDDTQLTLATAEAISMHGGVDPSSVAQNLARWFRSSRLTGIGSATYKALSELAQGGHWALVGLKGEMAAGNGAAMRIAPLAFYIDPRDRAGRVVIRDVCRITHHNEEAYVGALAVALSVRLAYEGAWQGDNNLIDLVLNHLPDSSVRDRLVDFSGISEVVSPLDAARQFGCSGYVVESVPLALFGAQRVQRVGFEQMMEALVTAGGDTDTIASIAGQIAGTFLGQSGLPAPMIKRLPDLESICKIGQALGAPA